MGVAGITARSPEHRAPVVSGAGHVGHDLGHRFVVEREVRQAPSRLAEIGAEHGGRSIVEVTEELEREMRGAAARLDFEKAALIRDQLLELRAAADTGGKEQPKRTPARSR